MEAQAAGKEPDFPLNLVVLASAASGLPCLARSPPTAPVAQFLRQTMSQNCIATESPWFPMSTCAANTRAKRLVATTVDRVKRVTARRFALYNPMVSRVLQALRTFANVSSSGIAVPSLKDFQPSAKRADPPCQQHLHQEPGTHGQSRPFPHISLARDVSRAHVGVCGCVRIWTDSGRPAPTLEGHSGMAGRRGSRETAFLLCRGRRRAVQQQAHSVHPRFPAVVRRSPGGRAGDYHIPPSQRRRETPRHAFRVALTPA